MFPRPTASSLPSVQDFSIAFCFPAFSVCPETKGKIIGLHGGNVSGFWINTKYISYTNPIVLLNKRQDKSFIFKDCFTAFNCSVCCISSNSKGMHACLQSTSSCRQMSLLTLQRTGHMLIMLIIQIAGVSEHIDLSNSIAGDCSGGLRFIFLGGVVPVHRNLKQNIRKCFVLFLLLFTELPK